MIAQTDSFVVRRNYVHDSGPGTNGEGIDAEDGSSNRRIYRDHVHDVNRLGIYIDARDKRTHDIEVFGDCVHRCASDGFTLASEMGGLLEDTSVCNNIACDNESSGVCFSNEGSYRPLRNINVVDNTIHGNGRAAWRAVYR